MTRALAALAAGWLAAAGGPALAQTTGCDNCGVVVSIVVGKQKQTWTPLGAMAPGTVPGSSGDIESASRVTSNFQIGKGLSNEGMVLLGSAGGAGYAKRPNSYEKPRWEVTVKMDKGPQRVLSLGYEPLVREGDRVRVFGSQIELEP